MSWPSCSLCPVQVACQADLSCLCWPIQADLSGRPVLFSHPLIMSQISCLECTVMAVLPLVVLPRLLFPSCSVLAVMFWPSFTLFPVLPVPSRLFYLAALYRLSWLAFSVPVVLPSCSFPAVLSLHFCPQLFCPLLSCHRWYVLIVLSFTLCPGSLS